VSVDASMLKSLIQAELAGVSDQRVVDHIRSLLVEPEIVLRAWDYGQPGQTFPCWTVLDDSAGSDSGVAYCEDGFGPRCPWGLVFLGDDRLGKSSIGMDSGWFPTFMEAYFNSFAATAMPIWRVFEMDGGRPSTALTDELAWDVAWQRCEILRLGNPSAAYMVHTPLYRL
jgi:hypothetical protein